MDNIDGWGRNSTCCLLPVRGKMPNVGGQEEENIFDIYCHLEGKKSRPSWYCWLRVGKNG